MRATFAQLARQLFGKQPRTLHDQVYAVLPVIDPITTAQVAYRFASRFNGGGIDSDELAVQVLSSVSRCLRRLRQEGLAIGEAGRWKRAPKGWI